MNGKALVKWLVQACILVSIVLIPAQSVIASTVVEPSTYIGPYNQSMFVPCVNDGAGEWVEMTGSFLDRWQFVIKEDDPNWTLLNVKMNLMGVTGIGQTTGMKYQVSGGWRYNYISPALPLVLNDKFTVHVVGPGKGNNYSYSQFYHLTISPNGTTVYMDSVTVNCK